MTTLGSVAIREPSTSQAGEVTTTDDMSRDEGHARSIGVSNFTKEHLSTVIEHTSKVPAVNQIELHPRLNQAELRQAHPKHNMVTQAYSPLGVGRLLDHPTVTPVAAEYDRTPAQVLV